MVKVSDLLKIASEHLKNVGIDSFRLDAEILLAFILEKDRIWVLCHPSFVVAPYKEKKFLQLLRLRLTFMPIAYIIGQKEFFGIDIFVNKYCLIPRPDTECLVNETLKICGEFIAPVTIFDICTGSGAVGIALAKNYDSAKIYISDISKKALAVAQKNVLDKGLSQKIRIKQGDLFAPFNNMKAHIITCNPPYIASNKQNTLMPDVRCFEPKKALFAKDDGLAIIKKLIKLSPNYLAAKGYLLIEIGHDQKNAIKNMLDDKWTSIEFIDDLAGHTRVVKLQRK